MLRIYPLPQLLPIAPAVAQIRVQPIKKQEWWGVEGGGGGGRGKRPITRTHTGPAPKPSPIPRLA